MTSHEILQELRDLALKSTMTTKPGCVIYEQGTTPPSIRDYIFTMRFDNREDANRLMKIFEILGSGQTPVEVKS